MTRSMSNKPLAPKKTQHPPRLHGAAISIDVREAILSFTSNVYGVLLFSRLLGSHRYHRLVAEAELEHRARNLNLDIRSRHL